MEQFGIITTILGSLILVASAVLILYLFKKNK